jgi:hypothetical protein
MRNHSTDTQDGCLSHPDILIYATIQNLRKDSLNDYSQD